jgi:nucleotidyltransferase/DNA polymerase involved in DNA repair
MTVRKIIHIDMDAFYASVEQRDDPQLRGKPVIVAWRGNRSVVCAASYEARKFGVRSAMPAVRAERLCPNGIFLPPDFPRYRAVSSQVREIFKRHTDLIEPLSLDEAYLDVSENKTGLPTATQVARTIRQQIRSELSLTASAGVAPNKFLAKIASDWKKPDGLFVIQPEEIDSFLLPLPVDRLPGVGKVTEEKLKRLLETTLRSHSELALHCHSERSEESLRRSAITPLRHSERSGPTFSSRPAPVYPERFRRGERSAGEVEEPLFKVRSGSHLPTVADLRKLDLPTLEGRFGRYGVRLYELARGIDNSKVVPDRPTQSISAEDTFEQDVLLAEMEPMIRKLAEHTWAASRKESRIARTVVLKLKTSEFKILTRSHTPGSPPASCEELTNIALSLRERVGLSPHQRFRLVGVGLSSFCDPEDASAQPALFI